jgi:hypothetical protein
MIFPPKGIQIKLFIAYGPGGQGNSRLGTEEEGKEVYHESTKKKQKARKGTDFAALRAAISSCSSIRQTGVWQKR